MTTFPFTILNSSASLCQPNWSIPGPLTNWEKNSGIDIKDSPVLDECIIFGFPNNTDAMQALNIYTIYVKYYIYIFNDYLKIMSWISMPA